MRDSYERFILKCNLSFKKRILRTKPKNRFKAQSHDNSYLNIIYGNSVYRVLKPILERIVSPLKNYKKKNKEKVQH